jgi:hypothetical protein
VMAQWSRQMFLMKQLLSSPLKRLDTSERWTPLFQTCLTAVIPKKCNHRPVVSERLIEMQTLEPQASPDLQNQSPWKRGRRQQAVL